MKKLITALAVCAATSLSLAAGSSVTSSNIVGFKTKAATGSFISSGSMFVSVGATNTWRLGDVTGNGFDPTADYIQFLSAADANVILTATYVDAAHAALYSIAQGWWNPDIDTKLDNTIISFGSGFLSNFSSPGVSVTYAGQVLQSAHTVNLSGLKYPMVVNHTPVDLKLSSLTCTGFDPTADYIQFLSTADATVTLTATYVDAAHAALYSIAQGWWNPDIDTKLDDTVVPSGAAFLCNLSSSSVTITFPNPMP